MQNRETQTILLRRCLKLLLMLGMILTDKGIIVAQGDEIYKEYVNLHLPRTAFIAGETVPIKAYCFSNRPDATDFLSKVVYIEIIDINRQSVLSGALQVEANTAASLMALPDTLRTGEYTVKAYTNWMKNFGDRYFYSHPIFVFNPYDNEGDDLPASIHRSAEPELFIEGGEMISDVPARLKLVTPGTGIPGYTIILAERYSDKVIRRFEPDKDGVASIQFTPRAGKEYVFALGDTLTGFHSYCLPQPAPAGYAFAIDSIADNQLLITLYSRNLPREDLRFRMRTGGKILAETPVQIPSGSYVLSQPIPDGYSGVLELELLNTRGDRLARQALIMADTGSQATVLNFPTNTPVAVDFDLSGYPFGEGSDLSVSIHKAGQSGRSMFCSSSFRQISTGIKLVIPRNYYVSKKDDRSEGKIAQAGYLVEDLGLIYSGSVINPVNDSPLSDMDVVLAIKDTAAGIFAARTDIKGKFAILLNETDNKQAYITLYLNNSPISGNYRLLLDQKFYYKALNSGQQFYLESPADSALLVEMKDEADRVLIQRAFGNLWETSDTTGDDVNLIDRRFYGKPMITVYPDQFFYLPNFEEIAREIVPRLRYKHNKKECTLILSHVEQNLRSTQPIILIDGNLIVDPCLLYDLDSDDIRRIELQTGIRASGNLLYDGLLAIYTTDSYKKESGKRNGRRVYPIPGYMNNTKTLVLSGERATKESLEIPDFKNLLYWNPVANPDPNGKLGVRFFTSDEEGDYIIEVLGFSKDGIPFHQQKHVHVNSDQ